MLPAGHLRERARPDAADNSKLKIQNSKLRSVPPGLLQTVVAQVPFAGVAERDLRLAFVDALARAVAVIIAVPADVAGAVGEAAALATSIEGVRAFVPTAQV